jgi:protein TonB
MRITSAGLSITVHVTLGAAIVWGTVDVRTPQPSRPRIAVLAPYPATPSAAAPTVPNIEPDVSPWTIPFPAIVPGGATPRGPLVDARAPSGAILASAPGWSGDPVDISLVEEPPAILAGPLPAYPELLRQAGISGRVVLEGVVDTTGRVEPGSLSAVSKTHPGFVAAAQRALAATLFRPGRTLGRAVRVRVRVPIEFRLGERGGR